MKDLSPEQIARYVVRNPEKFCRVPSVLGVQWAKLKEARGQTVHFGRVGDPAYLIDRPDALPQTQQEPASLATDLAERAPRVSAACARRKPRFLPPHNGVPA
jgi:hypothetical protein